MKKYFVFILIILCLIFIPTNNVDAAGDLNFKFNVYADNPVVNATGSQATLKVTISTESTVPIMACSFNLKADSGVSLVEGSVVGKNNWSFESGSKYVIEAEEGYGVDKSDDELGVVVLTLSYIVNSGPSKITFSDIECGEPEKDITGTVEPVTVSLSVASGLNVKIDGVTVSGGIAPPIASNKTSFALSAVSSDSSQQSNVKVVAKDTASGDVTLCSGDECREKMVDFSSANFCTSSVCNNFKISQGVGDNILLVATVGSGVSQEIAIIKEKTNDVTLDNSIATLNVWGVNVELVKGQTIYSVKVPANVTNYTVTATLSDSTNFKWDADDNPSKYNYKTNTINLIVRPVSDTLVGANPETYTINIIEEGANSSSSQPGPSSQPSSSSSQIVTPKPSSQPSIYNPQTGSVSQFLMAIILVGSLFISLIVYKNHMKEYQ